jgi:rubrerythrin
MEKQIEKQAIDEMAKVIERTEQIAREFTGALPSPTMFAKDLYWHGYRKQSEGEWVQSEDWQYDYICSVCGNTAHKGDYGNYDSLSKFCPNCGAKMKGGAE